MLIHPSSGACDLFVELFHGLYGSGLMCVGVVSICRLKHYSWDDSYQNVDGKLKWKVTAEQLQPYSDNTHISICNFTEIKGDW